MVGGGGGVGTAGGAAAGGGGRRRLAWGELAEALWRGLWGTDRQHAGRGGGRGPRAEEARSAAQEESAGRRVRGVRARG